MNWETLRRSGTALLWVLVVAGLVLGWTHGTTALRGYAVGKVGSDGDRFDGALGLTGTTHEPVTAVFLDPPEWVSEDVLIGLELLVGELVGDDPLDRGDLSAIREALAGTGWFDAVFQVRRAAGNRIEIVARFAAPVAAVRHGGRDHLVDQAGRLLPLSWPESDARLFGVIVGLPEAPPRRPGEPWEGAALGAALATLAAIDRQPWATQVATVDASTYARDRVLRLRTDRGSIIRWGRAPGDERAAEVPAATKLDYLAHHHRRFGHIDGGLVGEIDISGDVALVR